MSTAKSSSENAEWFTQGKQYWDNWVETQRKSFDDQAKTFGPLQNNWSALFKNWQQMTSADTGTTPGAAAFGDMFTKTGGSFIGMLEQFYKSTNQQKSPEDAIKDWMSGMQRFFETALFAGQAPQQDMQAQFKNFTDQFKNPFINQSYDFQSFQKGAQSADPLGFYASIPGLGYNRETQEKHNKLYNLYVAYEAKMRAYNDEMSKVGLLALQRFGDYVQNPPSDAAPLGSLKQVYVKWVDICEDIYAKFAYSEQYATVYGEVVNALMAFKKQLHIITDDAAGQMNMPTRAEVDSLHERVHNLRRDNMKLRQAVDALLKAGKPVKNAGKPVKLAVVTPAPVAKKKKKVVSVKAVAAKKKPVAKKPAPKKNVVKLVTKKKKKK